jgi:hypothetical protein
VKPDEHHFGFKVRDGRGYGGDPGGFGGALEAIASPRWPKGRGGACQVEGKLQGEDERQVEKSAIERKPKEAIAWQSEKSPALKFS